MFSKIKKAVTPKFDPYYQKKNLKQFGQNCDKHLE